MKIKSILGQILLAAALVAGTVTVWALYVPSAAPWLERAGVYDLLGLEKPAPAQPAERRGGFGGGGGETRVMVAQVGTGTMNDRVNAVGNGQAVRAVTIRAEATGRIVEAGFSAGQQVTAGDVLFRLDSEAEEIALARARLARQDAQATMDRLSRLKGSGAVSVVALSDAELALRNADLAIREAEFNLSRRVIRAPFAGIVGLSAFEVGERVTAQDELALLTDRSQLLIEFNVPERVLNRLELGMELAARPLALTGAALTGRISAIDNVVDRNSRTVRVRGTLDNADDLLRSGMAFAVTLAFEGDSHPSIDPLALQWSSEGAFVWAVREGKAQRVAVTIRQRNADSVLVSGELDPGETIVTEGVQNLRPGSAVAPVNDAGLMPVAGEGVQPAAGRQL